MADGTEVVHSQIINEDNIEKVIVHFERPTQFGFNTARYELPSNKWLIIDGYSEECINTFELFINANVELILKYAKSGGILSCLK